MFAKVADAQTGHTVDVNALLPTSNAQRYLQAHYTAPFADPNAAVKNDDARDGSAWSAANARFNDFFRQIVTRYGFEDALLIDPQGNIVYSAYKGVDLGSNILTGPYRGGLLADAYMKAMSSKRCRLCRRHRLRRLPARRRTDGLVWCPPSARTAESAVCSHCSFRSRRSTG